MSRRKELRKAYAHTCVPCSGMIVNLTSASVSLTHATFPMDVREPTKPSLATRSAHIRRKVAVSSLVASSWRGLRVVVRQSFNSTESSCSPQCLACKKALTQVVQGHLSGKIRRADSRLKTPAFWMSALNLISVVRVQLYVLSVSFRGR
jgi:hypothetical protein